MYFKEPVYILKNFIKNYALTVFFKEFYIKITLYMNQSREFDVIVWGASGFTGRLVAEYLFKQYGTSRNLKWAMAEVLK